MKRNLYLVTGGATGTGKAVAALLTARGAEVTIWGRRQDVLEAAVSAGIAQSYRSVDVADPVQVEEGFASIQQGKDTLLTGVIHCAGIWTPGKLIELDTRTIIHHIQIVTIGTVLVARSAAALMESTGGHIVIVAAASAKSGYDRDTALNTIAKRAIDGLQEGLRRELKGTKIYLTTIYPDSITSSEQKIADGKAMSYSDVASAVMFALDASPTTFIEEIVLTAPMKGR